MAARRKWGSGVRKALASASIVIASDLTLIESIACRPAQRLGEITEAAAAAHWQILRLGAEIVERARRPFPAEPLRTLDAIHLASALHARSVMAGLKVLSLDQRIRSAASQSGIRLEPG